MVIALAKGVSELYCLSFTRMEACTFCFVPDFVAETQNTSIHDPRIEKCRTPSLDDFVDGDRDELLLYPIRSLRKYLSWAECTVLAFPIISSQRLRGRNGCPEMQFYFGLDQLSATHLSLLPRRIADPLGSRHTKSGRW